MLDQYHITYKSLDEYFFPEGSCRNSHDYYMHECLLHETVIYEDHLKITGEEKVFNSKKYINIHARIDVEGWDDCISTDFLIRASTELLKKYNLTIEDINIMLPFERGRGHSHSQSPTIDRIVPANGYVKGNVQWVSRLANVIMSDATPDQVLQVGEYFYKLKG